jgi:hypothetical protein
MADSMVAGLFGLTPEMYQNQQYQQDLKRGYELAQLSPGAAAQAGLQASVGQLGRGVAGLMGVEDPQMKLISARQSIIGQLDQTNPTSMLEGAKILAKMGDQQGAFALADYARKAQSEIAQAQQRLAAGRASDAAAGRERVQADPEKVRLAKEVALLSGPVGSIEYNTAYAKSLREQIEPKAEKEKLSAFGQELVDAGLTPGTEPYIKRMNEYLGKKLEGASKGTGNVTIGGITVDTGAASKAASKIIGENVANVEQQFSLQTAYKDAIGLLDKGIYGGAFGPEKQFVAKYTGVGSPEKVRNTEVFMANIGEIVIPRLQQFGGNDSNEELKYLQNVVAGNQRLEPESMKRILASAEKKVQKNIERLRQQTQAGQGGSALPIGPISTPTQTPTKRWNPQTRTLETVTGE